MNTKLLKVLVCTYQGNVYTRKVYANDRTIYIDTVLASFDTYTEAVVFMLEHYPDTVDYSYWEDV